MFELMRELPIFAGFSDADLERMAASGAERRLRRSLLGRRLRLLRGWRRLLADRRLRLKPGNRQARGEQAYH